MQLRALFNRRLAPAVRFSFAAFAILHAPSALCTPPDPQSSSGDMAAPPAPFRAPYVPVAADIVLQDVPSASDPEVRRMRELKNSLASNPRDLRIVVQLSNAYVDYGREIGDAHYAGYAEAVLTPWLAMPAPPVDVLVVHGVILQYEHQFDPARTELQRALARDPANQQAWLTLSFIEMTQGNYDAAQKDCQHVGGFASLSEGVVCLATVRSFVGDAQRAQELLASIGSSMSRAGSATSAWILGLQAEVAGRLGAHAQEETFYRRALGFAPNDDFLLVAFADFLLDQNRPREAIDLLANHTQSDSAFLRIALGEQALHSPQLPRYTWIMSARFEALTQRGSALYDRERSRFVLHLLHDADGALALARGDWQQQRAPWDVRVLIEAALAADKPQAAADALALVERTHLQDPIIESLTAKLRARLGSKAAQ